MPVEIVHFFFNYYLALFPLYSTQKTSYSIFHHNLQYLCLCVLFGILYIHTYLVIPVHGSGHPHFTNDKEQSETKTVALSYCVSMSDF